MDEAWPGWCWKPLPAVLRMYHDSLTSATQKTNSELWQPYAFQVTAMNVLRQLGTVGKAVRLADMPLKVGMLY